MHVPDANVDRLYELLGAAVRLAVRDTRSRNRLHRQSAVEFLEYIGFTEAQALLGHSRKSAVVLHRCRSPRG
mgnify:CR=1 FL=1